MDEGRISSPVAVKAQPLLYELAMSLAKAELDGPELAGESVEL